MVIVRSEGENYQCETSLADLSEIANGVKEISKNGYPKTGEHVC